VANGGDPAVMLGYAVDFHATGVDHFAFADVPGATCPKIDLPYSPAALAAWAGAGADGRVRARQITDLAGAASGANVLVHTSDVTIDPVNHLVSFCVSHLSFYASMGYSLDATLNYAYLTTSVHSCVSVTDCNSGQVCNAGNCDLDLFAATPTLLPDRTYALHLSFHNSGLSGTSSTWPATDVGLWTVTTKPAMKLMQTAWHANAPQLLTSAVGAGQDAAFDVDVTTPSTENANDASLSDYPYGSALDLCLVNAPQSDGGATFAPFGECFSWEPSHKINNSGALKVPLTDVCGDGVDNDNDNSVDDPDGNPLHKVGASCDNGQSGTCNKTGHYVCDGQLATKCDAPTLTPTACGGCTALPLQPNDPCDTGQLGACTAGVVQCNGPDAVKCVRLTGPSSETCDGVDNDCNGHVDDLNGNVATEPGAPCDNGLAGLCLQTGAYQCNGPNATVCVTPPPPASSGIPCDVDPHNGHPAGTGACDQAGEFDCSGNCVAPAGIPADFFGYPTEPAHTVHGDDWDWNCDGQVDHRTSRVCTGLISLPVPGGCQYVFPLTETTDISMSCLGVDNCECAETFIPSCGQPGNFSYVTCRPGDETCIDTMCTAFSLDLEGCH
jgi:hypothetical protein